MATVTVSMIPAGEKSVFVPDLSMKQVIHDPARFQTRAVIDKARVKKWARLIRDGLADLKAWPAVHVIELPDGSLVLSDGFHRWDLYVQLRKASIRAMIFRAESTADVLVRGITENLIQATAMKVSEDDKQHAAKMMIRDEECRMWSDKLIGRTCGLASTTVRRIRLNLYGTEGIPIPARVRVFRSDGTRTNRWMPYRLRPGGKPTLTKNTKSSRYLARINGKQMDFGLDVGTAVERLEREHERLAGQQAALTSRDTFSKWLMTQRIYSSGFGGVDTLLPARVVGSAVLVPLPTTTTVEIRAAVGSVILAVKDGMQMGRVILVGLHPTHKYPSLCLSCLPADPVPMEFMTPDDVVAEFGPGGPSHVAGPADPTPPEGDTGSEAPHP
jgi:hypothetical protein